MKHAIPEMEKAGGGAIVNISSISGMVGQDDVNAAYNASKGAVRIFTKSVAIQYAKEGIRVNSVHPGGIKTNIAKAARMDKSVERITGGDKEKAIQDFEKLFRTTPAEAASTILKGVRGNKRRVLIGSDAVAVDTMQRLLPTSYQKLVAMGQKYMNKK